MIAGLLDKLSQIASLKTSNIKDY